MDYQLIEAAHEFNSIEEIANFMDMEQENVEKLMITMFREAYPKPLIETSESESSTSESEEKGFTSSDDSMEEEEVELSEEQQQFIDLALEGKNLFLTASAGYGKSYVIAHLVKLLKERYDVDLSEPSRIAVCGSTGRAAALIKGTTVHSKLGIGLAKEPAQKLYERLITIKRLKPKYYELKQLKVLIIDEISMVNDILFEKIAEYFEMIKKSDKPFGKLQVILVGDLFQLPPVFGKYFYESNAYKTGKFSIIQFNKCFRQTDPVFQKMLNQLREGICSKETYDILLSRNEITDPRFEGMKPCVLNSTNLEVDSINSRELNKLCEEQGIKPHVYKINPISYDKKRIDTVMKLEGIPEYIELIVGAQVMVTQNISLDRDLRVCNGSMAKVLEIYPEHIILKVVEIPFPVKISYVHVGDPDSLDPENPTFLFSYMPLRLAYSVTIHKMQGCSADLLEVNLSKVFTFGQGYVSISRVRSLEGLVVKGLKKNAFKSDPKIIQFYRNISN